jgi:hypothetical protein
LILSYVSSYDISDRSRFRNLVDYGRIIYRRNLSIILRIRPMIRPDVAAPQRRRHRKVRLRIFCLR